jgi:hypothetical protein
VLDDDAAGDPIARLIARADDLAAAAERAARVLEPLVLPAPAGPLDADERAAWHARRRTLLDTPEGQALSRLVAATTALKWARRRVAAEGR